MKNLKCFNDWLMALALVFISVLSCSENTTEPLTEEELIGQWAATEIEGAIDENGNPLAISAAVSTWIFSENGTYIWFLHAQPIFTFDGTGTYSLDGSTLTVTGIIANTLFSETSGNSDAVALTFGSNSFSFRDEDGDRWSYARIQ